MKMQQETQALLTASEAQWFQTASIRNRRKPAFVEVGSRLLNERISRAGSEFSAINPSDIYDPSVPYHRGVMRLEALNSYERESYSNEGLEEPCIELWLPIRDQLLVLGEADIDYQVAIEAVSMHAEGKAIILPGLDVAIAEVGGVEAGFEFADYSTRLDLIAAQGAVHLQEAHEKISLTSGIITAISNNIRR